MCGYSRGNKTSQNHERRLYHSALRLGQIKENKNKELDPNNNNNFELNLVGVLKLNICPLPITFA